MASSEPIQSRHVSIVLMDDLPLRRASIHSLLRDWAQDEGISLEITEAEGHTVLGKIDPVPHLLVYNAGHSGATSSEWRTRVDELRRSFPEVPLVVISEDDSAPEVIEALRAGVRGFISARTPPAIVFQTLYFILAGGVYFPPSALLQAQALNNSAEWRRVSGTAHVTYRGHCSGLTERQAAVWRLLQRGHSNKVIARELAMCESTVKVHMRQIMRKLGATNRTQAALCSVDMVQESTEPAETGDAGPVPEINARERPQIEVSASAGRELEAARAPGGVAARFLP